ncbi:hypothetical protein D3C71_1656300 [compost metagenome]
MAGGFFQHLVERSARFADPRELHQQRRKQRLNRHSLAQPLTVGHALAQTQDRLLMQVATAHLGHRAQRIQQRHPGGIGRGQAARKTRQRRLPQQLAEHRQPQHLPRYPQPCWRMSTVQFPHCKNAHQCKYQQQRRITRKPCG